MCYVHNQWYDISCTTLYTLKNESIADLILYTFLADDTYKQVYHQQVALILKYKSTATCFSC